MDTSDPTITFDGLGVCSHCRAAVRELASVTWTAEASARALAEATAVVRNAGGGDYDCVIGLSGGVDSSFVAYLARTAKLRPLAVHFDNGWNSGLAVENIQRVVEGCGFDLQTYVIDWREFRDLQRAFLRASVVDIELLTDHAISAAMATLATRHQLKYVLSGYNVATEHGMPRAWFWDKADWTNIRAIHQRFGDTPLRTYPHRSRVRMRLRQLFGREPINVELLNLINYRRDAAAETLKREFGWREYGGKHHESTFTRFYQNYILPTKFGIDKRRPHLSARIRNGELSRDDALAEVSKPAYGSPEELAIERDFVLKKLGFTDAEFEALMKSPPRSHADYPSDRPVLDLVRRAIRPVKALQSIIPRSAA
jgi:N-acetyl sugar amidotransferase